MAARTFIAIDLGAESGRTMVGSLEEGRLSLRQVTRFPNEMKNLGGHLHWDIYGLFASMKDGLRACAGLDQHPVSIGVDTWGVDYGLLGPDGSFPELPYSYRDHRTDGMMEKFFEAVPRRNVYELTGIQFMQLNTLFQLFAAAQCEPDKLERASRILFMPDIFNYFLSGATKTEFTFATTSQLLNPFTRDWDLTLLGALGIRRQLLQEIIEPGTTLGRLTGAVAREVSLPDVAVVAVGSHDTASAIAAIPAEGDDWAYISSGTWSLMGVELPQPVISDEGLDANFTNEGGVGGRFRFLKNIMGLWPLQQCRKEWSSDVQYSYDETTRLAESAPPFRSMIDPDFPAFFNPTSMTEAIRDFCRCFGQPAPESHAEFIRCIFESLALKYRSTFEQLLKLTGKSISRIHIIGGGAQNSLLCQYAANATGVPVLAGPVEATAIGNILVQAMAAGYADSLVGIREIVRRSFKPVRYEPAHVEQWNAAFERFCTLRSRNL